MRDTEDLEIEHGEAYRPRSWVVDDENGFATWYQRKAVYSVADFAWKAEEWGIDMV